MAKRLVHKGKNKEYVYERTEHDKYLGKCPEACPKHGRKGNKT